MDIELIIKFEYAKKKWKKIIKKNLGPTYFA